jgi:hypothetical protein
VRLEGSRSKNWVAGVSLLCMKRSICFTILSFIALLSLAETRYDFRASAAYAQLSAADQHRLEQVRRDQVLLWGALDLYADEHDGGLPATLDDLVPRYLAELPADPFATRETANSKPSHRYAPSKEGWGYRYQPGAPGNRAWVIASVGLPQFPYLAEKGNVGLYICKGVWISGINPISGKAFRARDGALDSGPL